MTHSAQTIIPTNRHKGLGLSRIERERQRDRERQRETETETQRERERERERQKLLVVTRATSVKTIWSLAVHLFLLLLVRNITSEVILHVILLLSFIW